jgi:hypothetical protein
MNVKNEPWKPDDMANRTGGLTVDQTLDKMAENAKELGLDYEPKKAQKPVAWFTEDNKTDKSATTYDKVVAERWKQKGWPATELYTAPPKREWVSLSEKEVQEIFDMDLGVYESIEETMRQLEEKNK